MFAENIDWVRGGEKRGGEIRGGEIRGDRDAGGRRHPRAVR